MKSVIEMVERNVNSEAEFCLVFLSEILKGRVGSVFELPSGRWG